MLFRLEKQFNLRIPRGDLDALFSRRQPSDATAGELCGYIRSRLWDDGATGEPQGPLERDVPCPDCGYNLRGLVVPLACPECGWAPGPGGLVWACVQRMLSDAVGYYLDEITPDTWLVKDLGVG